MGLKCTVDPVVDLNYPSATPVLGLYIDYGDGCDAFLDAFFDIAYDLCPVDTGELISSIDGFTDGESVEVCADADYAQYVEYGTSKMDEQPYFRPALAVAFEKAKRDWQEAVDEAMEEEAEILAELRMKEEEEEGGIGLIGMVLGASNKGFWNQMTGIAAGYGFMWAGGGLLGLIGGFILGLFTAFIGGFFMFLNEEQAKANAKMKADTKRGTSHSSVQYSGDYSDLHIEIY